MYGSWLIGTSNGIDSLVRHNHDTQLKATDLPDAPVSLSGIETRLAPSARVRLIEEAYGLCGGPCFENPEQ